MCQGNSWSCLRHEEPVCVSHCPGAEILPAVPLSAILSHQTDCTQSSQDPVFSSTPRNRLQDTAPAQMGRGSNKLQVCIPEVVFRLPKDTKTSSCRHNRCLRSHHSQWRASPWGRYKIDTLLLLS